MKETAGTSTPLRKKRTCKKKHGALQSDDFDVKDCFRDWLYFSAAAKTAGN